MAQHQTNIVLVFCDALFSQDTVVRHIVMVSYQILATWKAHG